MQDAHPGISVIIRNRNGARYLRLVLEALKHQQVQPQEIILVDNESTDESVTLATHAGARIVTISQADFTYGRALNKGMAQAQGEICVLLSVHCLPVGPHFLETLLPPFNNHQVAAVRCLNINKVRDVRHWFEPDELRSPIQTEVILQKGPVASACAVRKKVWETIPFDENIEFSEDKKWSGEVLSRGYIIDASCPAPYLYMRPFSLMESIQRKHRADLGYYRITKRSRFDPWRIVRELGVAVLWKMPRAGLRELTRALLKSYYRLRLPIDERREPGEGSLY